MPVTRASSRTASAKAIKPLIASRAFGDREQDVGAAAGEVVIQQVAGHVGSARELVERERPESLLGDERHRDIDQLLAACPARKPPGRAVGESAGSALAPTAGLAPRTPPGTRIGRGHLVHIVSPKSI